MHNVLLGIQNIKQEDILNDIADSLLALVNKYLLNARLRPTPGHTLYSLRHTIKDLLIAVEAPERVQDALMGHKPREIEYGSGPSLEKKAKWLEKISFRAPAGLVSGDEDFAYGSGSVGLLARD